MDDGIGRCAKAPRLLEVRRACLDEVLGLHADLPQSERLRLREVGRQQALRLRAARRNDLFSLWKRLAGWERRRVSRSPELIRSRLPTHSSKHRRQSGDLVTNGSR